MTFRHSIKWQPVLCTVALIVSMLLIRPFAEMGLCDDFSYIRTVKYLAETGHLNYFGWATPMLGWQLLLGALFVKIFGFSFSVVRASVFIIAIVSTMLLQRTFVLSGLRENNAVVATLILVLSPLYLPLSFSFMSDVAGLFSIVLCLYCCLRAIQSLEDHLAFRWLLAAAISSVITGTARQISWLGVLVLVPSAFWLLRHRRPPLVAAVLVWLACVGSVFGALHWFQHQPFSQQEKIIRGSITYLNVYNFKLYVLKFALGVSFYLLPIFMAFFTGFTLRKRRYLVLTTILVACAGLVIAKGLHSYHRPAVIDILAPFDGGIFGERGAVDMPEIGTTPIVFSTGVRFIATLVSFAATLSFVFFLFQFLVINKKSPNFGLDSSPVKPLLSWLQLLILIGPFTLAYLLLLIPRGLYASIIDRYMLPLLVIALILCIRFYQETIRPSLPAIALVFFALFAAVGIAATHDKFATQRTQLIAVQELLDSGVPRNSFYAGFEYDGWTQIDEWGYVDNERVNFPAGFHPYEDKKTEYPCGYLSSARFFPAIHPRFGVSFSPDACQGLTELKPVTYHNWLPPYSGSIYIVNIDKPTAGNNLLKSIPTDADPGN